MNLYGNQVVVGDVMVGRISVGHRVVLSAPEDQALERKLGQLRRDLGRRGMRTSRLRRWHQPRHVTVSVGGEQLPVDVGKSWCECVVTSGRAKR